MTEAAMPPEQEDPPAWAKKVALVIVVAGVLIVCGALYLVGAWVWRGVSSLQEGIAEAEQVYDEAVARQNAANAGAESGMSDTMVISGAQSAIVARAVDPDSVRFRNVRVVPQSSGVKAVCGEFNAKNRAGGYNGFERFLSAGIGSATWVESEVADFDTAWTSICAG